MKNKAILCLAFLIATAIGTSSMIHARPRAARGRAMSTPSPSGAHHTATNFSHNHPKATGQVKKTSANRNTAMTTRSNTANVSRTGNFSYSSGSGAGVGVGYGAGYGGGLAAAGVMGATAMGEAAAAAATAPRAQTPVYTTPPPSPSGLAVAALATEAVAANNAATVALAQSAASAPTLVLVE